MKYKIFAATVFALIASTHSQLQATSPRFAASSQSNPAGVTEVTSMDALEREISMTPGMLFVDCYSSSCPPCRKLAPIYQKIATEKAHLGKFLKVNVSQVREVLDSYDIRGVPTLLVFKDGTLVKKVVGMPEIPNYFKSL